jgi:hypothetical protein
VGSSAPPRIPRPAAHSTRNAPHEAAGVLDISTKRTWLGKVFIASLDGYLARADGDIAGLTDQPGTSGSGLTQSRYEVTASAR